MHSDVAIPCDNSFNVAMHPMRWLLAVTVDTVCFHVISLLSCSEMLGSVSDYSIRESPASICIVRSTGNKFDRQAKFCTDGSHAAALAFCVLVKSMMKPMDIVNVVMISTTDGSKEQATIDHYHSFMLENKVRSIRTNAMTMPNAIAREHNSQAAYVLILTLDCPKRPHLSSTIQHVPLSGGRGCLR